MARLRSGEAAVVWPARGRPQPSSGTSRNGTLCASRRRPIWPLWVVSLVAGLGLWFWELPTLAAEGGIDLGAAHIVVGEQASSQEQFAARELQRYLSRLGDGVPPLADTVADGGVSFVVGTPAGNPHVARLAEKLSLSPEAVGDQGFWLWDGRLLRPRSVCVAEPAGG